MLISCVEELASNEWNHIPFIQHKDPLTPHTDDLMVQIVIEHSYMNY